MDNAFMYFILPLINTLLITVLVVFFIVKYKAINTRFDDFEIQIKSKIGSVIKGVSVCNLPK